MRHQMWALLIAAAPIALWSAPGDRVQGWFTEDTVTIREAERLDGPEDLYRAAQAMELHGHLQQAQDLYARAAAALPPGHRLADDVALAQQIVAEKLRSGSIAAR